MTESKAQPEYFSKQRRNALAASALLVIFTTAGLRLETLDLLGAKLKVDSPDAMRWLIWAVFVYCIYRYYVYFRCADRGEWAIHLEKRLTMYFISHARGWGSSIEPKLGRRMTNLKSTLDRRDGKYFVNTTWTDEWDVGGTVLSEPQHDVRRIHVAQMCLCEARANAWTFWNTPFFTDYYFPFVAAGAAVVVSLIYSS